MLSGPPDPAVRALAAALAAGAIGRLDTLARVYETALGAGIGLPVLREGALMMALFAGFPRAIEAFAALEQAAGEWPADLPGQGPGPDGLDDTVQTDPGECDQDPGGQLAKRGAYLFETIYGRQADAVRKRLVRCHPALERSVLSDAYGRILARPALPPATRELMAVCALAASELPVQLRSHLHGALRCGASRDAIDAMADVAAVVLRRPVSRPILAEFDAARRRARQVTPASDGEPHDA